MRLIGCVVLALAGLGCSHGPEPFGRMTPEAVQNRLGKPNVFIYDNNSRATYDDGHVPGARWVDYQKIQAGDLPSDKTSVLIFYCASEW